MGGDPREYVSARQLEILRLIHAGLSPFHGALGTRRAGPVARNLERLIRRGMLRRRGGSSRFLTKKAIALLEGAGG